MENMESNAHKALRHFIKTFYYLYKSFDDVVKEYPYAIIFIVLLGSTIVSFVNIANARAERDSYNKELLEIQDSLEQYKIMCNK